MATGVAGPVIMRTSPKFGYFEDVVDSESGMVTSQTFIKKKK